MLILLFCIHFHLSKEGKRKKIELFQTPKLQRNSHDQYCIVTFKSIVWALVYAIIVIIFFQGTTFARKWTLDVLGQASLPAILKTTGRGIQALQDPQFENRFDIMYSVLIFHYTDSFSCCNILARLFPSTNCYHFDILWTWVLKQNVDIYRNLTQVLFLYSFLNTQVIQWWTFKNSDLFFRFQLWPLHCELMTLVKKWRERLHKIFI